MPESRNLTRAVLKIAAAYNGFLQSAVEIMGSYSNLDFTSVDDNIVWIVDGYIDIMKTSRATPEKISQIFAGVRSSMTEDEIQQYEALVAIMDETNLRLLVKLEETIEARARRPQYM